MVPKIRGFGPLIHRPETNIHPSNLPGNFALRGFPRKPHQGNRPMPVSYFLFSLRLTRSQVCPQVRKPGSVFSRSKSSLRLFQLVDQGVALPMVMGNNPQFGANGMRPMFNHPLMPPMFRPEMAPSFTLPGGPRVPPHLAPHHVMHLNQRVPPPMPGPNHSFHNKGYNNFPHNQHHNHHHYQQNHHHQRNAVNGAGDHDEYAGLMTSWQKQWLLNIQNLQLNVGPAYIADYYYTVSTNKVCRKFPVLYYIPVK